jgi:dienelactone hydrolase
MKKIISFFILTCFFLTAKGQVSEKQERVALQFLQLINDGQSNTAYDLLDSLVMAHITRAQLESFWPMLQKQVGSFKQQFSRRSDETGGYDYVYLSCEFEKMDLDMKVVFPQGKEKIVGFFLVPSTSRVKYSFPSYADTSRFTENEIVLHTGEFALPGTLSIPKGPGPFPLVILVHGSGPNDRDETIGPNKPFKDLAVGLASNGIACLRYEKRTRVAADRLDINTLTLYEETVEDVISAVNQARTIKRIDPKKIIVLGHSLGGYSIPLIVSKIPNLYGVVMMAASARPLEDLVLEQTTYILGLDSLTKEDQESIEIIKQQNARVKQLKPGDKVRQDSLTLGLPANYWLYLNHYPHLSMAAQMKCRVLVLQGERDYQVNMKDFALWQQVFAKRKNVTMKSYPSLNHLFIEGTGKSRPEEYMSQGHIPDYVIRDIVTWINSRGKLKK